MAAETDTQPIDVERRVTRQGRGPDIGVRVPTLRPIPVVVVVGGSMLKELNGLSFQRSPPAKPPGDRAGGRLTRGKGNSDVLLLTVRIGNSARRTLLCTGGQRPGGQRDRGNPEPR